MVYSEATSPGISDSSDSNFDANWSELGQCLHGMHVTMALIIIHVKTAYLMNLFKIPNNSIAAMLYVSTGSEDDDSLMRLPLLCRNSRAIALD